MSDALLRELAARAGIASEWIDQTGANRVVSPETLRAILRALGLPSQSEAELRQALAAAEAGGLAAAGGFLTARLGQPVELPARDAPRDEWEVHLEDGSRYTAQAERAGDRIVLPPLDAPGYHRLVSGERSYQLAVAPARCVTFRDISGGRRGWGIGAQIYSLCSELDGGIGNFAGVAALGRSAAGLGADALAISPVHALYGALPDQFSPYSPSTRLFYNPLHADPATIFPVSMIRELAARAGLAEEMERLSQLPLIDWPAAAAVRQRLLRSLFEALDAVPQGRDSFERYADQASPLLRSHAVFEVLHAAEIASNPGVRSWRDWRPAHRDPGSAEVAAFAAAHALEVRHQIFLQWLTGLSYDAAQRACREAGMAVGLIADLAIGMDGAGSHAWSRQDEVLLGLSIGAPPDYYAAQGQNWALTTFSPRGLAASGYASFIDTLRASLRHAGGLRIDHVMGMSRLWLIPEGAPALEGAYVTFPAETLFRLMALESLRHGAIVIGEDLGTLPHGFRDYLRDQGVAGLRVLRFERTQHGYVRPWDWDPDAVAMTSTHDLAPMAGWWADTDLSGRDDVAEGERAWERGVLWGALRDAGIAQGDRPAPEDTASVVDAAVRYVAATPCTLKIIPAEDALGSRTQPNVPGTTIEKPNWRHRLPGEAAGLLDRQDVRDRLAALAVKPGG